MYPKWAWRLFATMKCRRCNKEMTPFDIKSIGIEENPHIEAIPLARVIVCAACRKCGKQYRIIDCQSIDHVLIAMRIFHSINKANASGVSKHSTPPPQTLISDKEVRVFLNRLKRTSFKRKSKSFKAWMKDMGAPIDGPCAGADDLPI